MRFGGLLFLLSASSLFGCGSDQTATTDGGAGDLSSGADLAAVDQRSADLAGGAPDASSCSPPMKYGGGETTLSPTMITAKVVDETGAPVVGQPVYICGLNLCTAPAVTDAAGGVSIQTSLPELKPAFKVGDALNYSEIAIPLAQSNTDFTAGGTKVLNIGKLSDKTGATLAPGTSATSGDVTIDVPPGATVGIDTLVYSTPSEQQLRTVSIPLANDGAVLASAGVGGFAALYGLAPAETPVCPPAKVTVQLPHATMTPNDFGWAPGDAVELWIMTTDTGQQYAPYAGWAKASDGVVSADGKSVSTVDGQGFIFLESFAIRKP